MNPLTTRTFLCCCCFLSICAKKSIVPPKPSASSNKKKMKSGKKKENSKPNKSEDRSRKEQAEAEKEAKEKALADEYLATPVGQFLAGTNKKYAAAKAEQRNSLFSMERILAQMGDGRFAIEMDAKILTTPDEPPCDGCSKPFAGTLQCSKCQSVFYCSRECQVSHWTTGGHKTQCKLLNARNEDTAKRVLESFEEYRGWTDLDVAGAYNAAVRLGLHDKIREVLLLDKAEIVDRFKSDLVITSCTELVMSTLFRGQLAEGNAQARSPSFNCIDGQRVKGYVTSHPDALDVWLQASVQHLRAVFEPATLPYKKGHEAAILFAREVWEWWSSAFSNSTAARAILTPFPSSTRDATGCGGEEVTAERKRCEDHVYRIVQVFRDSISLFRSAPNDSLFERKDVRELQGLVYHVAAMVQLRTHEYGIGVDVERSLNLDRNMVAMYRHCALPKAKRIIEKGRPLNKEEADEILYEFSRKMMHSVLARA